MNQAMRPLLTTMMLLAGAGTAQADDPKTISRDFCYAVAAQALCDKTMTMKKGTEARLQTLAGQKLRGEGEPLHQVCNSGYNEFYNHESADGRKAACTRTMEFYGPNGSRRAGLVASRGAPQMKSSEKQVGLIFQSACYAEAVAKECPGLNMVAGHEQRLKALTGVSASEKLRYFSDECGRGAFRAANARHKAKRPRFCSAGLAMYGPTGTVQGGWLTGSVQGAEAPKPAPAATPSIDATKITEEARAAANTALASVVDSLCRALNTSRKAAKVCPNVKGITGIEGLLQSQLGSQVGSVAERCAKVEPAGANAGSTEQFCQTAIAAFGPKGTEFPNMLEVEPGAVAAAEAAKAAAPAGAERTIYDAVPVRPANFDAVQVLGIAPGTMSGPICEPYVAAFAEAQTAMKSAATLADKVTASIELTMAGMVGQALCPAAVSFTPSTAVADEIKATGLEACHIVDAAARTAREKARPHRQERRYLAMDALDRAVVWAYETYQPVCSKLTERRVASSLKFARDTVKRSSQRHVCLAWSGALRAEMKAAGDLARNRRPKDAIAALDTKALAALYGVQEHCEDSHRKYPTELWLTTRKRFQLRL